MKLTIIGASGHGKVVADIASLCGYDEIEFLDDNKSLIHCGKWPVVGICSKADDVDSDLFVAIGNAEIRKRFIEKYSYKHIVTLIHPSAIIAKDVKIGFGTVVMAGAVINPDTQIGNGCIINTCASVDHDCVVGDYSHVSVGAHLCGTVSIGESAWIGAGSTVINNVSVCGGCMIGAGAVVVKNIDLKGTYIGIPARIIDEVLL